MEGILDTARALRTGATDPVILVEEALDRLERWEPALQCTITTLGESALVSAHRARDELAQGQDRGPLHGIPIAVKDIIDVSGVPTTAASEILRDNVPISTAPIVEALRTAGAIVLSKTNTHEFALGALTPPTRNPHDLERIPGGSSGGSAAIVGAGIVRAAIGTDTAGSIREPAAMCGVVGLKPSAGRLSNTGVVPLAWSLDTVGPIAATVEDCATMFASMAPNPPRRSSPSPTSIAGTFIAVWTELSQRFEAPVRAAYSRFLDEMNDAGGRLEEVSLGDPDELVAAAIVILGGEALSYHRPWYETRPDDYRPDVRDYLDLASTFTAADFVDAERVRRAFTERVDSTLRHTKALLTPAQIVLPPPVTTTEVTFDDGRSGPRDLTLIRPLAPFNLTGHPAVSVPVTYDQASGLPVSVQLVAPHNADEPLLELAEDTQRASGFVLRHPTL